MDRNTIIAIVLSVIVITVGMTINSVFFNDYATDYTTVDETTTPVIEEDPITNRITASGAADEVPFTISTEAYSVTLEPRGAAVSSIMLNNQLDVDGEPVELVLADATGRNAFLLYLNDDLGNPLEAAFNHTVEETDDMFLVDFSQDFELDGHAFQIIKHYAFPKAEEYLFRVGVEFESLDGSQVPVGSYALGYDPQVGPAFESLSSNYGEFRRAYYTELDGAHMRQVNSFTDGYAAAEDPVLWAGTSGKYFAVMGVPDSSKGFDTIFRQEASDGVLTQSNAFYFSRTLDGGDNSDVFSYYAGPKLSSTLGIYDHANENSFGLEGLELREVLDSSSWLGWLQNILKWVLDFFYRLIPNYGVAIILLTLLIKLLLQPLSKKGMDSTAKMSALSPKLEELKVKYADNPEAMNAAMAKLYKDEGINPMGSCLPMLIQFPILIALYGMLNTHYDLRGAMFIPGWIPDLSVPETIFTLPFNIPFLGNQVHLLPIIYTASMIFSMKITQTTNTQSAGNGMMKFMTYGMPIIFFFVLYNTPSGLLVYWTMMNFISIIQQVYVNRKKKDKFVQEIAERDEAAAKAKAAKKLSRKKK